MPAPQPWFHSVQWVSTSKWPWVIRVKWSQRALKDGPTSFLLGGLLWSSPYLDPRPQPLPSATCPQVGRIWGTEPLGLQPTIKQNWQQPQNLIENVGSIL